MKRLIFNADVGEKAGFDEQIMPYISWCNISCGSHAGNEKVIKKTVELALKHEVKIGAHPSYPDRENFGRISMALPKEDLVEELSRQVKLVKDIVVDCGGELHHVKPHGALYNDAVKNRDVATAIVSVVKNIDKSLYILTQKDSKLAVAAEGVLLVKNEVFADRNYNADSTLVSRQKKDAVITDPNKVFEHVYKMVSKGGITTIGGEGLAVDFDTICVHGDNPKSVDILKFLHAKFSQLNYVFR